MADETKLAVKFQAAMSGDLRTPPVTRSDEVAQRYLSELASSPSGGSSLGDRKANASRARQQQHVPYVRHR
jgi:hypothetical protein